MKTLNINQLPKPDTRNRRSLSLNWLDNPNVKNLLDVLISILAEEYTYVAENNRETFKER